MSQIIMSEEFMAKAKSAKSFNELESLAAAEGVELADDEPMARWEELPDGAKKFKLTEEELDTVAGGDVDSLEGVYAGDLGADFWFDGHFFKYTGMEATDSQGRRCIIYAAEDGSGFILLPKK